MVSELNVLWEFLDFLPAGFIFGFFDNFILLIGAYTGINIEKYIDQKASGVLGGVVGAGLANSISDGIGALIDPNMNDMFVGIVIGTILPLFLIPIIEKIRK
jgi:hypothetical protein|tara:strand:+ start:529 stop:834 length:306 start_codon:yes stop_codon:yes gene_type:complete